MKHTNIAIQGMGSFGSTNLKLATKCNYFYKNILFLAITEELQDNLQCLLIHSDQEYIKYCDTAINEYEVMYVT